MKLLEIIEDLEKEFEYVINMFPIESWKFFKFGRGGPYYEKLVSLTKKKEKYDKKIFNYFELEKDTASFGKLIVLCLRNETPKTKYKAIDTIKRQLRHMKRKLNA